MYLNTTTLVIIIGVLKCSMTAPVKPTPGNVGHFAMYRLTIGDSLGILNAPLSYAIGKRRSPGIQPRFLRAGRYGSGSDLLLLRPVLLPQKANLRPLAITLKAWLKPSGGR